MPRLTLSGVRKQYGATVALAQGELDLRPGEIHVLMGANGSGKSTLCKIVAGSVRPDEGEIVLDGTAVRIDGPKAARELGVSIFYQELSLADNRTVAENISMSNLPMRRGFVDRAELRKRAAAAISPFAEVVGDGFDPDIPVGRLRADQRQLVEIMKTLSADADILIFDEPTSALDRAQTDALFAELKRRKAGDAAIVFISHRMEEIFEIGDRVTVIRDGSTVASNALSETSRDEIVAQMVGEMPGQPAMANSTGAHEPGEVKLRVENLSGARLSNVSLELRAGEIVGLGGLHGQGQSALLRALFGAVSTTGRVQMNGVEISLGTPRKAIARGMAYISGDRGRDGAITDRPILENVSPIYFLKHSRLLVRPSRTGAKSLEALATLSTKFAGLGASIGSLSGGNQQKVVIARWLIDRPEVLLLDDPTKGIDLATKLELFALIRRLAAEGLAIVLYSSEDAELLTNSDRILVFNNGGICRELTGEDRTRFNLTQAAYEAA